MSRVAVADKQDGRGRERECGWAFEVSSEQISISPFAAVENPDQGSRASFLMDVNAFN
jgi:hypothetical protein